jgi:REP element-mobilizing transposase RayT
MPRKAREKIPYGTYLIQQSCAEEKVIFESDTNRQEFLQILSEKKAQFHFKIYGYCLADTQNYKLIIYDNGSDISKIMKSINISYAYCIRARGKIFKDRYKSNLIKSPEELYGILNTLHDGKPCCDYSPNIFGHLLDSDLYFTPSDSPMERIITTNNDNDELCLNINPSCKDKTNCIRSLQQGEKILASIAESNNQSTEQLLSNKQLRNKELLKFRKRTTLSLKDIGLLFGGLSESAVCKIISRNKERQGAGNGNGF